MIRVELYGDDMIRHYSDSGFVILQVETGIEYAEAIDGIPCPYTYIETDELIDKPEEMEAEE